MNVRSCNEYGLHGAGKVGDFKELKSLFFSGGVNVVYMCLRIQFNSLPFNRMKESGNKYF